MFAEQPEVKKALWWSSEFFVSSCEKDTSEKTIKEYIKNQGKQDSYEQIFLKLSSQCFQMPYYKYQEDICKGSLL
ncbi:transposase [Longibaculum muris]|uniref:transposase n=1 Tax=Longibaculum muris TaxID=1796628 RepID=UPI0009ED9C9A|nr:transposase [Coprobacillus cateniformis]